MQVNSRAHFSIRAEPLIHSASQDKESGELNARPRSPLHLVAWPSDLIAVLRRRSHSEMCSWYSPLREVHGDGNRGLRVRAREEAGCWEDS